MNTIKQPESQSSGKADCSTVFERPTSSIWRYWIWSPSSKRWLKSCWWDQTKEKLAEQVKGPHASEIRDQVSVMVEEVTEYRVDVQ